MDFAIKTILTANDAQLKQAFGDAGSEVAKLGRKLQAEAEKSESKWHKFKEGFKESFSFGAAAGIGAMVGEKLVGGISEAVKALPEFAEKAETIGRTSQKLGMSAEYYQRLSYAMKMTDIPAETMEKSFKKLNVGFAQLQKMQGPIESGLKRLDPQLMRNIRSSKNAGDAFKVVADAVKATEDPSKRAAIAQAVFGKGGQDLIPILLKGSDGINQLMTEADKYGSVLSDKTIGAGEEFADNLKKIKGMATSLKDTALAGLLEGIGPIVSKMTEWLSVNKGFIQSGISSAVGTVMQIIQRLEPVLARVFSTLLPAIGDAVTKLGPILDIVFGTAADLIDGLSPAIGPLMDLFGLLAGPLQLVSGLVKTLMTLLQGPFKLAFQVLGAYINGIMMVWSQTIGRLLEGILQGVAAVMKALGKDTSGVTASIKAIQDMRASSTAAIFGGGNKAPNAGAPNADAPNSGVASGYNMHLVNNVNVDNSRAPGVTSQVRTSPQFSAYPTTAGYAH
jgi:phage-related protein